MVFPLQFQPRFIPGLGSILSPVLPIQRISNKLKALASTMTRFLAVGRPRSIVGFGFATHHLERNGGSVLHAFSQVLLSFLSKYHTVNFVQIGKRLHVENVRSDDSKLR